MVPLSTDAWAWFGAAGLGAFHGLNPAMGWLFAVALGLHRDDRRIVWLAPVPIAVGHAVSVAAVTAALALASLTIDTTIIRGASGLGLIAWGLYHWRYGHRHRVRFGMQAGLLGLGIWSLLMASAHGAGLMLWPVLTPLCTSTAVGVGPIAPALIGIALHSLAMLTVTVVIAVLVYQWIGVGILRRAWVNLDFVWTLALVAAGGLLLLA